MLRSLLIVVLALLPVGSPRAAEGIASWPSAYPVTETVDRLEGCGAETSRYSLKLIMRRRPRKLV